MYNDFFTFTLYLLFSGEYYILRFLWQCLGRSQSSFTRSARVQSVYECCPMFVKAKGIYLYLL